MLDGVGVAGDYQPDAAFRENVADLLGEVSDDLYVTSFSGEANPPVSVRDARAIATEAANDPQAHLVPADAPAGSPAARRVAFARDASCSAGVGDGEVGYPSPYQRMRIGACDVTVFGTRQQVTEATDVCGVGEQFGEEFAQRGDFRPRSEESQLGPALCDDPLGSGPARWRVLLVPPSAPTR